MQDGIGIDINSIGAMPTPVAAVVAPTPFEMPQVGIVNNTITSTAPLEAPSTMVMNAAPGVTPIMTTTVGTLATPFEMPQAAPAPVTAAAPVIQAIIPTPEQTQVIETQAAPVIYASTVEPQPILDASDVAAPIDMAGLGLESTVVHTTVLPTIQQEVTTEQVASAPLSAAEENGLISRMSAAQYDNFIKILDSINSDTNALVNNISNGTITLLREGGTLTTKINHIFGDKSWVFNNPGVQLKRLKFAKSEGETIVMNDGNNDVLVSKNKKGETTNIVRLTQMDEDFLPPSLAKDYGERKYSCLLEKEQVRKLVDARSSYEKTTFHITIDKNTNEIVKLHLGEDYVYPLLNDASRELKTYTVTQLFPIVEEAYISMYVNDRNEVSFKTSVDVYNATISFHIGADEYIQSIVANLQI